MARNECVGLFGRWFGHKFESLITKYAPNSFKISDESWGRSSELIEKELAGMIESTASKEFKVVCVRCGVEK
jgi:hypothetical protein